MEFTSSSGQDVIAGTTRFTMSPETIIKLDKLHETMVFKTLDIRQWEDNNL